MAAPRERLDSIVRSVLKLPELADLGADERKQTRKILKALAARPDHSITRLGDRILGWFWTRFYTSVDLNGLDNARAQLGGATPVYLSTHRSHLDYLLLSWALYRAGLAVPLIAAGVNLNLPVVGAILRRGGAFFIRRSFKGDPLYRAWWLPTLKPD